MELPQDLRIAIDSELASIAPGKLQSFTSELSRRYREGNQSVKNKFLQSREDIEAYAAFRLPATFAAVYSALSQVKELLPDFNPQSFMDAGAGPGTAMWAAASIWPGLKNITLLEREMDMIKLGKRLAQYSSQSCIKDAEWINTDITKALDIHPRELVISSYVIGELTDDDRTVLIKKLWESTENILLIIEPGTKAGSQRIKKAREQLISSGAFSIAPCPHNMPCSMDNDDWCHFSQRVARSRLHRQVKSGELSYEDEKFSFLCMSRTKGKEIEGRLIRHPQIRKGHIILNLCTPDGLKNITITKKNRELFKAARDLHWGSVMPPGSEIPKE